MNISSNGQNIQETYCTPVNVDSSKRIDNQTPESQRLTRVQLIEQIEEALKCHSHVKTSTISNEPKQLDANYPTLQQHSQHWTLNFKQHAAFLLIGTALLKTI